MGGWGGGVGGWVGSVGSGIGGWVVSSITFPLFLSHRLFAPPTPLPIPNTHVSTSALALLLYLHVYRDTLCKIAWEKSHNHLHKCIQQLHLAINRVRQLRSWVGGLYYAPWRERYKFLGIGLSIKFDLHFNTNKMDYLTPLYSKVDLFIQEAWGAF